MMCRQSFLRTTIVAVLSLVGLQSFADDPIRDLWTKEIRPLPTGAYERGECLFVNVRQPVAADADLEEVRLEAAAAAHDVLVDWALKRTAPARNVAESKLSPGIRRAMEVAFRGSVSSKLRWEWRYSGNVREFEDSSSKKILVLGQAFNLPSVTKSIPDSFSRPLGDGEWRDALSKRVRAQLFGKGAVAFLKDVGALDGGVIASSPVAEFPQWEAVDFPKRFDAFLSQLFAGDEEANKALHKYLLTAAPLLREEAVAIAAPVSKTAWKTGAVAIRAVTNVVVTISTNAIPTPAGEPTSETQLVPDPKTASFVNRPTCVGIFETKTVAAEFIVTTNHVQTIQLFEDVPLSKIAIEWRGDPRFQRLFLGAGCISNTAEIATAEEKIASSTFFDESISVDEKTVKIREALCRAPGASSIWNLYGRCFLAKGDSAGAIVALRNALRIDIANEFAWANLAVAWRNLGHTDRAVATAVVARGLAKSGWTVKTSEDILEKKDAQ